MAGHSKWANIKHKKEAKDAQRSNIFTKMSRLITTAVQEGGGVGDPDKNFRLRLAVDRARAVNMPKDTIQRAIDKGAGVGGAQMKELVYEAFGPGGVAMIITAITDNSNRTLAEVKQLLDKNGGKIAGQNAVSHMFVQCGMIELSKDNLSEEAVLNVLSELDGIDLEDTDEAYIMYIPFENIGKVGDVLSTVAGISEPSRLDIVYRPLNPIVVDDEALEKVERLAEILEDNDDVQGVYVGV